MKNLTLIILLFISYLACAQRPVIFNKPYIDDPQVKFTRLTSDEGLSHNRVTDIIQDIHGFIWVSTTDGLNRYDGKQFEVFKHNDDNFTSLTSSYILCLEEGANGDIYIGTKEGLNVYNRITNSFRLVSIDSEEYNNSHPHIRQLLFDNDSLLWIETLDGYLINFDVKNEKIVKRYKHTPVNQTYYLYHSIYKDKSGTLWLGSRNTPPMYLDEKKDKIVRINTVKGDYSKKRECDMACYYEDSYGNFWITALDGVYTFNKENEVFTKFLATTTYDVKEDRNGNIWFATGSGVLKYIPSQDVIFQLKNEKDNPNSISNNSVHKIMIDKLGNFWFATSKGVNIYSPPSYPIKHFTHIPGISNSPEGYYVTAVEQDNKNNLWIGYENDGLDCFDIESGKFSHFLNDKNDPNSIASNKVSALLFDNEENLWVGLWRGIGFNQMDIKNKKFSLYTYNSKTLEYDWYNDFVEDNNGNFYIGFWGANGLTSFDRNTMQFSHSYKNKFERVDCSRLITKFLKDDKGSIWFGTTACGIHRYFPEGDSAISYFSDENISNGLFSNNIVDITMDKSGNIWLINDKLQKYWPEKDSFSSYSYSNGLTTKELTAVLADNNNDIWVSTVNQGIFKFDQLDLTFTQFVKQDGLQSNSFTKARMKLKSGELFFGCTNGFSIFNPDEMVDNRIIPTPYFGRLYVFDHIVSHDLNQKLQIILEPDENVFSIELLSTDIVNPERYSYQCKLIGFDKEWVDIDNKQRIVRYASVPSGSYQLGYRIGNRKGIWSEETASVLIKVKKPYYFTWWFIISVIVVFLTVLVLLFLRREFDLKQKRRNIELQQRLFRLQMNPHFMYNSLLAIQNFIFLHEPKEAGNYLSDFARLFRLILNNSQSEFIQLEKEIETLNLYLNLQSLRYPEKFTYKIDVDPKIDPELIMIPPMLAQPMIENALEHGLFYKEGKGNVDIRFIHDGSKLLFEVEDNGVGLSVAKDKSAYKPEHKSSALNITRERIKILSKRHRFYAVFEIKEIVNEQGDVRGTSVKFTLPFKQWDK